MIIEYEGGAYPFDFDDVELLQAMAIEERMGVSFSDWAEMLGDGGSLRALQCLGWLVLTGGDVKVPIADTNFKMVRLGEAFTAARAKETAASAQPVQPPDPTTGPASPGQTSQVTAAAVISADGSSAPA